MQREPDAVGIALQPLGQVVDRPVLVERLIQLLPALEEGGVSLQHPVAFQQRQGVPGPLGRQVVLRDHRLGQFAEQLGGRVRLDQAQHRLGVAAVQVSQAPLHGGHAAIGREPPDQQVQLLGTPAIGPLGVVAECIEVGLGGRERQGRPVIGGERVHDASFLRMHGLVARGRDGARPGEVEVEVGSRATGS